jgi:adenylate cyclase
VDLELARSAELLLEAGLGSESFLELTRVMSQAMDGVAAAFAAIWGEALLRPGDNERDLGLRYAESLRRLGPLAGPSLGHMLLLRMRERVREAVIGQAELRSGRLPGSQRICVCFVDIVGFTELGEQVAGEELGALIGRFERRAEEVARPPVRLVKTIGDAAMLVSSQPDPLLRAALELVEGARDEADAPMLRAGVALGDALPRAGDWYGRPVNLASRLTAFARRGSVVASEDLREAAAGGYDWSFAGRRRFKGVSGEVGVFRARSNVELAARG